MKYGLTLNCKYIANLAKYNCLSRFSFNLNADESADYQVFSIGRFYYRGEDSINVYVGKTITIALFVDSLVEDFLSTRARLVIHNLFKLFKK